MPGSGPDLPLTDLAFHQRLPMSPCNLMQLGRAFVINSPHLQGIVRHSLLLYHHSLRCPTIRHGFRCYCMVAGYDYRYRTATVICPCQVEKAMDRGIDAVARNSTASEKHKNRIILEITGDAPEIKLLYTTPESLRQGTLHEALQVRPDSSA